LCKYCGHNYKIGKNPITKNIYGTSYLSRHVYARRSIANLDVDLNLNQEGMLGHKKSIKRFIVSYL